MSSGVLAKTAHKAKAFGAWLRRRFRPIRRLKLTREGRFYILITFGVGFVGILTANNLLYVLLGMLLSLIIVSGVLSEASLRDIRVTRRLPQRAQVGRPHLVEVQVWNDKKSLPSYAIEVEDLRQGQPADKRCFFLKVSPGSSQVAAYRRIPGRRGLDCHTGFRVATRFPFGLFEKSRTFDESGDLIIYPAVDTVQLHTAVGHHMGEGHTIASRGGGDDILGVRVMRDGDDPRDIYWRRSVGIGPPVVIERAREVRSQVRMTLDNLYTGQAPSEEYLAGFERRVRDLASRAVAHVRRGERVRLETTSGARADAHPETGTDALLRFLALVDAESTEDGPHPGGRVHLAAAPWRGGSEAESERTSVVPAIPNLSRPAQIASRGSEADFE
jgi:uncharacterized protein (DUF58 family)